MKTTQTIAISCIFLFVVSCKPDNSVMGDAKPSQKFTEKDTQATNSYFFGLFLAEEVASIKIKLGFDELDLLEPKDRAALLQVLEPSKKAITVSKWERWCVVEVLLKNGDSHRLHIHNAGSDRGVFKIGRQYWWAKNKFKEIERVIDKYKKQ